MKETTLIELKWVFLLNNQFQTHIEDWLSLYGKFHAKVDTKKMGGGGGE